MPEGDSIYKEARKLDAALKGRRIVRGELRVAALAGAELVGTTVLENDTHGKHLLTRFDNGQTLHTHLRMDGSWTVVRPGRTLPRTLDPDIRVLLAVEDGPIAYGLLIPIVELVPTAHEDRVVGHLGPDPLREDWDAEAAIARLAAEPVRPINAALLDQRGMAGSGQPLGERALLPARARPVDPGGRGRSTGVGAAGRPDPAAFGPGARGVPGHDGQQPARAGPLGRRSGEPAVPALPHPDPHNTRGERGPGAAAHLVVSALPARAGTARVILDARGRDLRTMRACAA